jgi:hypothetical protein
MRTTEMEKYIWGNEKFVVQEVERTIEFLDDDEHIDESEPGEIIPADFRLCLDWLNSANWDSIDERGDGTIICYPVDSHQDMYSGVYTQIQIIIRSRKPEWADRLMRYYRNDKWGG